MAPTRLRKFTRPWPICRSRFSPSWTSSRRLRKDVRRVQDASIGAIYDVVHRVNREVAKLRGSWLGGRLAERPPQPARPAGRRRGARPPRRRSPQRRGWGASCTAPRSVAAKRRRTGSTATIISAADVPPAGGRPRYGGQRDRASHGVHSDGALAPRQRGGGRNRRGATSEVGDAGTQSAALNRE